MRSVTAAAPDKLGDGRKLVARDCGGDVAGVEGKAEEGGSSGENSPAHFACAPDSYTRELEGSRGIGGEVGLLVVEAFLLGGSCVGGDDDMQKAVLSASVVLLCTQCWYLAALSCYTMAHVPL